MSWPASWSARKAGTAKSGMPKKAMRTVLTRPLVLFQPLLLGELAHDHVALERGQVIDEQDAVQVVDLVLQAGGQQAVGLYFALDASLIEIADFHAGRAGDIGVLAGQGQASFFPGGAFLAGRD